MRFRRSSRTRRDQRFIGIPSFILPRKFPVRAPSTMERITLRDPPAGWDEVTEEADQSFPASDPPGNCQQAGAAGQPQSSTTFPLEPSRIAANPSANRATGKRWVMTRRMFSPFSSIAIILYHVSKISRP
ncbi:hypothetical protein SAMN05878503_109110 [Cereibacter ovatus]|uniref:Uncharacterized protein n=1 Tax=Cereibacter ovatus TaxID=439529 RepID=A0A285CUX1_9RHOB|nr:hypothetical protein SAMN05878503_109110 [Cereibacter ovatus]